MNAERGPTRTAACSSRSFFAALGRRGMGGWVDGAKKYQPVRSARTGRCRASVPVQPPLVACAPPARAKTNKRKLHNEGPHKCVGLRRRHGGGCRSVSTYNNAKRPARLAARGRDSRGQERWRSGRTASSRRLYSSSSLDARESYLPGLGRARRLQSSCAPSWRRRLAPPSSPSCPCWQSEPPARAYAGEGARRRESGAAAARGQPRGEGDRGSDGGGGARGRVTAPTAAGAAGQEE